MSDRIVEVKTADVASEVLEWLPRGAFLTVSHKNRLNTMTVGWGTVGILWSRPVFMAAVRRTRYTYNLIERSPTFTVSIPTHNEAREALAFCGTKSGSDVDKFAACGLGSLPGRAVDTPVVDVVGLHFECRTLLRTPMSPDLMDPSLATVYPSEDYHTFYYGEVVSSYRLQPTDEA